MIKKYWKLFMIPLLAVFVATISTTSADAATNLRTGSVTLTEEERYDPEYYLPLDHVICSPYSLYANTQMSLESYIIEALQNWEEEIDLSDFGLSLSELKTKYFQILNNESQFFYVHDYYGYRCDDNGNVTTLYPRYRMDADTTRQIQAQLEGVVAEATSLISEDMQDYEKALVIHDWLVTYCEYDYENYLQGTIPAKSHELYGALLDKTAVCDGYAKAYRYIMQHGLGIPCYLTSSKPMNHAWNIIQIGEHYYHVDATWDDPVGDVMGQAEHTNFLLSDIGIQNTRSEGHHGWETTLVADDTSYDDSGLWWKSNGNIIYYDSDWYFIDENKRELCKTDNILNGSTETLDTLDRWVLADGTGYSSAYSYPYRYHDKLIYNGPKQIYVMSLKEDRILQDYTYTPAETSAEGQNIYGVYLDGTTIYYVVKERPYSETSKENDVKSTTLQQDEIAGSVCMTGDARYDETLMAEVTLDTGISNIASYTWYRDGVAITGETGATHKVTREDINAVLSVTVTHKHYSGALTAQTELVQKAVPALPEQNDLNVEGELGFTLSDIELPDGYTWLNPDTTLTEIGTADYDALYCPDSEAYESISLKVSVRTLCVDHVWDDGEIIVTPDCLTAGTRQYMCKICQVLHTEPEPATGHLHIMTEPALPPTCTENGYTESEICEDCGTVIIASQTIPATGHLWDDGEVIREATITTEGLIQYTCQQCNATSQETIEKLKPSVPTTPPIPDVVNTPDPVSTTPPIPEAVNTPDPVSTTPPTSSAVDTPDPVSTTSPTPQAVNTPDPVSTTPPIPDAVDTPDPVSTTPPTPDAVSTPDPVSTIPPTPDAVSTPEPISTTPPTSGAVSTPEPSRTTPPISGAVNTQGSPDSANTPAPGDMITIGKLTYQIIQPGRSMEAGTVAVIKATAASTIVIPASIVKDNITYKVVSIAPKAFMKQSKIKKITIGANIQLIGKQAFYGCKKLKTIQILSKRLKSVSKNAIKNIHKKAVIKCPSKKQKAYQKLFGKKAGYLKTMKIK